MVRSHAVLVSGLPILCQAPWSSEEAVVSVGQGQEWACSHQHPPLSSQEVAPSSLANKVRFSCPLVVARCKFWEGLAFVALVS